MAFCPYCGASLTEDAKFCTSCGSSLVEAGQPAQSQPAQSQPASAPVGVPGAPQQPSATQQPSAAWQPPASQQAPQPPASSPAGKNYETLGGWLLFFVICYGVSAAVELYRLVGTLNKVVTMFSYIGGIAVPIFCNALTSLLGIVGGVAYIVLIVKKYPNFLRLFQIIRIAVVGGSFLLTAIAILSYGGGYAVFFPEAFALLVSGAVGIVLMTLYFCKSVRVRVYMGTTTYLDTALFKIGA